MNPLEASIAEISEALPQDVEEIQIALSAPLDSRRAVKLLGLCGLTHKHVARAVGVTSDAVDSWSVGRAHPNDDNGQRLDLLRALAARILSARKPGDNERLVRVVLNGYVEELQDADRPRRSALDALEEGEEDRVIEAIWAWSEPARVPR